MGTRSFIALEVADGEHKNGHGYLGIYCHWDGYPDHNGRILFNNYNTRERVRELVDMGSVSILSEKIGTKHAFGESTHEQGNPHFGECTFYHRDRGDELDVGHYPTLKRLMKAAARCGAEYVYIFTITDKWFFAGRGPTAFGMDSGEAFSKIVDLAPTIAKLDKENAKNNTVA